MPKCWHYSTTGPEKKKIITSSWNQNLDGPVMKTSTLYIYLLANKASRQKNEYFKVRLTVSSDPPPFRSTVCDFFGFTFDLIFYDDMFSETDFTQEKVIFRQLLESLFPPLTAAALQIIICNRPAPHFDSQEKGLHFWDPLQWDKMWFEYQRVIFHRKMCQNFHHCLRSGL